MEAFFEHWITQSLAFSLLAVTLVAFLESLALVGRFIGPTRPLVPLVAGMLDLSPYKFAIPNIIGCVSWPPVYLLPGILAGVAINIPAGESTGQFRLLLLCSALLLWLACWLLWRWGRSAIR